MGFKEFTSESYEKVKGYDMYGKRITFTYKGEEEYKTFLGGLVTVIILIIMALYFILQVVILFGKLDTDKSTNLLVKDLLKDDENFSILDTDFSVAFSLVNEDGDFSIGDDFTRYLDLSITQYYKEKNELGYYDTTYESFDYYTCGTEYFKYDDSYELNKLGITEYQCPETMDFYLQGNQYNDQFNYFEVVLSIWDNTTTGGTCQSLTDIENALTYFRFDMAMVNSFFDFEDYDNPIHTYLDDRYKFEFAYGIQKTITVYIRENEGETKDNFFQYLPNGKEHNFISVENVISEFRDSQDDTTLIKIRFVKDYNYSSYERQIYSFLDMFGNLGGVFELLGLLGGLLVGIFADRYFNYSIVSAFYQVDPLPPGGMAHIDKYDYEEEHPMPVPWSEDMPAEEEEKSPTTPKTMTNKVHPEPPDIREEYMMTKDELKAKAKENMEYRRFYNYSAGDFAYNLLWCWKWWSRNKHKPLGFYNRFKLYEQGVDKFVKEFDAHNYTRSLRNLKIMIASLMDDSERFMAVYQHRNTISLLKSDSESGSDDNETKGMPMLLDRATLHWEDHRKNIDKFFSKYFSEQHSSKDLKLLKGSITSKRLDNKELNFLNPLKQDSYEDVIHSHRDLATPKHKVINDYNQQQDKLPEDNEELDKVELMNEMKFINTLEKQEPDDTAKLL